jgi:hypothetical protein
MPVKRSDPKSSGGDMGVSVWVESRASTASGGETDDDGVMKSDLPPGVGRAASKLCCWKTEAYKREGEAVQDAA